MFNSFNDFYALVKDTPVNWHSLRSSLKIREQKYPNNQDVEAYYLEVFNGKTSNINRSKWHSMDKMICVWTVSQYCNILHKNMLCLDKSDFKTLSNILGINSALLEFKWLKLIKPYIKNIPWSQNQDKLIYELIQLDSQKKWTDIALKLSKSSVSQGLRTAKQVRERWINYIDPQIKRGDWSQDDDSLLLKLVRQYGKKWSVLGKELKRTQNSIKNRFNSLTNKMKHYDGTKFEIQKTQSSKDSPTIIPKVQENQRFCSYVLDISAPKMFSFQPLQFRTCGYRQLLPSQRV